MLILEPNLISDILAYLDVKPPTPNLNLLDALVAAYVRKVPWESASRIVRRAVTANTKDCPRWPEIFWKEAMLCGTGGTCFESNYAFFALLKNLGYEGYLTINDMSKNVGCHTAIIIRLNGEKWLVDVGLPLFVPIPIQPNVVTHRSSPFLEYTVYPVGDDCYDIERAPHPKPVAFTLVDRPIAEPDYRTATTNDYGERGLFLNSVIINKIVNEQVWRFSSDERPYHFESFRNGEGRDKPIKGDVAIALAAQFGIDETILRTALDRL